MLVSGVDVIEIPRIRSVAEKYGQRFLDRIYTPREVAFCRGRAAQLAGRFAAKEAVMKALGTGIRGVRWRDIEIVRKRGQAPQVLLHGTALARAKRLGIEHLAISISDTAEYAVAFVVGDSVTGNLVPPGQ